MSATKIILAFAIALLLSVSASAITKTSLTELDLSQNMPAALKMGTNKITGLGSPTDGHDAAINAQVAGANASAIQKDATQKGIVTVGFTSDCNFQVTTLFCESTLQAAIDYAYTTYGVGGVVKIMGGVYNFTGNTEVKPKIGIQIEGLKDESQDEYGFYYAVAQSNTSQWYGGTCFRVMGTATSPLNLSGLGTSDSNIVSNIIFWYPKQATNATPTAYAPSITVYSSHSTVRNCNFYNSYIGIKHIGGMRNYYVNNQGNCILYGIIYTGPDGDCGRIAYNHFCGSYFIGSGTVLQKWSCDNGIGIYQTNNNIISGGVVSDNELYNYQYGIYSICTAPSDGTEYHGNYIVCQYPMSFTRCRNNIHDNVIVGMHYFYAGSPGYTSSDVGIQMSGCTGSQITKNRFLCGGACILASGSGLLVKDNYGQDWGVGGVASKFMVCPGLNDSQIVGNSIKGTTAYTQGLYIYGGSHNLSLKDNVMTNLITYPWYIDATCYSVELLNNNVVGSPAPYDLMADGADRVNQGNHGLNPIAAPSMPAVPSSTVAATNTFGYPVFVEITGGTTTVIKVNNVVVGSTTPWRGVWPNRGTIAITYSSGPSWTGTGIA